MRTPGLRGIGEDSEYCDSEWEYYYEEEDEYEDELKRLSPTATTAPTTRATSPFPSMEQVGKDRKFGSLGLVHFSRRNSFQFNDRILRRESNLKKIWSLTSLS